VSARPGSTAPALGVIGPGRAGTGLALAWARAGYGVRLHGRRRTTLPESLTLTVGPIDAPPWIDAVDVVVLAVPDGAIGAVAEGLAARAAVGERHVVLHLSGALDWTALRILEPTGAALGSLHPLQTIAEPERAPEHLQGAWAAIEGKPRATATAERLARDVGLHPVHLPSEAKARYHAAAVFASNYFVVVEAVAERLLRAAGFGDEAWRALEPLVVGTLANLRAVGPSAALTGPVRRGDVDTVRRNLAALSGDDAELYRALATAALALARSQGLDESSATAVRRALAIDPPRARPGAD
jgi:predicted short-subunit dehydrogenase-like oxidoreductase (DUF2520 family)